MVRAVLSKYHCPGVPSSSYAFSMYAGALPILAGPTRFAVRTPLGNMMRFVELSQHGCAMVMVVPSMAAAGQRGSVQGPSPCECSDQMELPPVYTNSMPLG